MSTHFLSSRERRSLASLSGHTGKERPALAPISEEVCLGHWPPRMLVQQLCTPGEAGLTQASSHYVHTRVWAWVGKLIQASGGPSSKLALSGLGVGGYFQLTSVWISWQIQNSKKKGVSWIGYLETITFSLKACEFKSWGQERWIQFLTWQTFDGFLHAEAGGPRDLFISPSRNRDLIGLGLSSIFSKAMPFPPGRIALGFRNLQALQQPG